jgi:Uncharacterized conserved protein
MVHRYPIILSKEEDGYYFVTIPDFGINTQGTDLENAIYMARDAVGLMMEVYEEDGRALPIASVDMSEADLKEGETLKLVDIDFTEYRRKVENGGCSK